MVRTFVVCNFSYLVTVDILLQIKNMYCTYVYVCSSFPRQSTFNRKALWLSSAVTMAA